ncbi:MAG: 16S rRNA (guanine(527)-N(7))-methyltransferase RsmG [Oscillospiraceae bacterium]
MINSERFKKTLADYDINLTQLQLEQLELYAKILVEYNEKVNLTAITDSLGIENKHFLDSLLFAKSPLVKGSVADVGTGAGFPGIVAKIYKPDIDLTLIEPTGKRCVFLQYALDTIGIKGTVVKERAEEAARKGYREKYDLVTARAVAELRVLCEYCIPLVKLNGNFVAMKSEVPDEIINSKQAASKLGAKYMRVENFVLPDQSPRSLVVYFKNKATPDIYPRNGGKINKSPL